MEDARRSIRAADSHGIGRNGIYWNQVDSYGLVGPDSHRTMGQVAAQLARDPSFESCKLANESVHASKAGGRKGSAVPDDNAGPQYAGVKTFGAVYQQLRLDFAAFVQVVDRRVRSGELLEDPSRPASRNVCRADVIELGDA